MKINRLVLFCCAAAFWPDPATVVAAAELPVRASPAHMTSPVSLQAELLRRINIGEPVSDLFLADATIQNVAGWRGVLLLGDASATQPAQMGEGDVAKVRLRVRVRRQTQMDADCPVVDAVLAQESESLMIDELGWLEATYRRGDMGWRIARLSYRSD